VERFDSTLTKITRCLKISKQIDDTIEFIMRATIEYNRTVHSVTYLKIIDAVHASCLMSKN